MQEQALKVALVTGASGGLGRAVAVELARRGWSIFAHHCGDEQAISSLLDDGELASDVEIAAAEADLSDPAAREQLVEAALEHFGRIDMLVNAASAGPAPPDDLLEMTEDAFAGAIDSTLTATVFLTQLVANEMVRMVEGGLIEQPKIVTINSISSYTTSVNHGPQCMARAALSMMTHLLADRLGEHGINVYEVSVGLITAGPGDPAHEQYDDLIDKGLTPIRRWGRPGDVARTVSAIAEDLLGFSTGETINVDGGFHLRRL